MSGVRLDNGQQAGAAIFNYRLRRCGAGNRKDGLALVLRQPPAMAIPIIAARRFAGVRSRDFINRKTVN
jgi:hypothetical protein